MTSTTLDLGTTNAHEQRGPSQNDQPLRKHVNSLHDLLSLLAINPPSNFAMLRTTAGHLTEYFGTTAEEILIASLQDCRGSFRKFLRGRKYKNNSVRTFSNHLGILVRLASELGWSDADPALSECWREVAAAFPTGARNHVIKYALKLGRRPDQLSEDDLATYRKTEWAAGKSFSAAQCKLASFKRMIRLADLASQFPLLRLSLPSKYRIRLEAFPDGLRNEVQALLRWRQDDFAPGRPQGARHSKATAKTFEAVFSSMYGYAINIEGRTGISNITDLVTEDIATSYTAWSINVRKKKGPTFKGEFQPALCSASAPSKL